MNGDRTLATEYL